LLISGLNGMRNLFSRAPFVRMRDLTMKAAPKKSDASQVVAKTLAYLTSNEGRSALRTAAAESKKAAEPFRRARDVAAERLHRRFTV
jgi:hypothetical protein